MEEAQPIGVRRAGPPAVVGVLAICAVGLTAAIVAIGYRGDPASTDAVTEPVRNIRIGQGVPTDFGAIAVERVERQGLGALAPGDRLDVTIALINLGERAVPVASIHLGLRGADGVVRSGAVSADAPRSVAPDESVRATFGFALPVTSRSLQLELRAPTMARPVIVSLGPSTRLPLLKELDAPAHTH